MSRLEVRSFEHATGFHIVELAAAAEIARTSFAGLPPAARCTTQWTSPALIQLINGAALRSSPSATVGIASTREGGRLGAFQPTWDRPGIETEPGHPRSACRSASSVSHKLVSSKHPFQGARRPARAHTADCDSITAELELDFVTRSDPELIARLLEDHDLTLRPYTMSHTVSKN